MPLGPRNPQEEYVAWLNRLAGTTNLEMAGAANALAGTTGLEAVGALNAAAGTSGLEFGGAVTAASQVVAPATPAVNCNVAWHSGSVYALTSYNPTTDNPVSATITIAGSPLALTSQGTWGNGYTWAWNRISGGLDLSSAYTVTVTFPSGSTVVNMPAKTGFDPGTWPAVPAQP